MPTCKEVAVVGVNIPEVCDTPTWTLGDGDMDDVAAAADQVRL